MATKKHEKTSLLTIIEAVETLSNIADLNFDQDNWEFDEESNLETEENTLKFKTINWLRDPQSFLHMKTIFKVVLDYLKNFYREENLLVKGDHTLEGIKTIMVLVGEAAKKLDHFVPIFNNKTNQIKSITEVKEYKELQNFYQKCISNKIDESLLGKWILGLTKSIQAQPKGIKELSTPPRHKVEHVFVDLETVKKDSEYELFYLRKADGSRFFNAKLIKNMKLVSDFGRYFDTDEKIDDPLFDLDEWKDRIAQTNSEKILRSLGRKIDQFFRETGGNRKQELAGALNSALMALMLGSYHMNRETNHPIKACREYFQDFQTFLYEALQSREYQKYMVYHPSEGNKLAHILIELTNALCKSLFVNLSGYKETLPLFHRLLYQQGSFDSQKLSLSDILSKEYELMAQQVKVHPNGPLVNLLNCLEIGECNGFAPLKQGNDSLPLYSLYDQEYKCVNIRMPAPIFQDFIDKVSIDEAFNAFLYSFEEDQIFKKHLIVNMQDRTGWRESTRCHVLENLEKNANLNKYVSVITLAFDTEFYHQSAPYDKEDSAEIFKDHFYEHLIGESSGYYFSDSMKEVLFPHFTKNLFKAVHRIFFSDSKQLTRENRRNFIDICYFFLLLKVVETVKPSSFSMTCKDGIDIGGSFNLMFYSLMKMLNNHTMAKNDRDYMHYIAYIPSLLIRERIMISERFERFISLTKKLENLKNIWGDELKFIVSEEFDLLYQSSILHSEIVPYQT